MQEQQTRIACPHCDHLNRAIARFCGNCGSVFSSLQSLERSTDPIHSPQLSGGPLPAGTALDHERRYIIEDLLGKGGFGEVYKARDSHLDRICVVKRMTVRQNWSDQQRLVAQESFGREARLLVELNSPGNPHIPDIYAYFPDTNSLVMKHIEGKSLASILDRSIDGLPIPEALRYTRDVCAALVYMHTRTPTPVLHRDIKPANVLLDTQQHIWLIDFGLSKALPKQVWQAGMKDKQAGGTRGFTPPEQWAAETRPRSDVYALAATLYMLLVNRYPPPPSLVEVVPDMLVPRELAHPMLAAQINRLIQHGMAENVEARPTAQEFLHELDQLLAALEVPPPPEPRPLPGMSDFVGRQNELMAQASLLHTRGVVVIVGMAGVGKTSLAAMLARHVADNTATFWHSFHTNEGIEVLLRKLAAFLAYHGQTKLWHMLHHKKQMDDEHKTISPDEQLVLSDYVLQMLRDQRYLLCLDDVQFLENTHLVELLYQETQQGHLQLILTTRCLPSFVSSAEGSFLDGLTLEDTARLLAERGVLQSDDLVKELWQHTRGNAQFLTLAMDTLSRASDPEAIITQLAQTNDIEHYLLHEVDERLTDNELAVMQAVAILLEHEGTRDVIEAVLDQSRIQRTLHELTRRHLLILSAETGERLYGMHAILQSFFYAGLSRRERRAMHHRAALYYDSEEEDILKAAVHYAHAARYQEAAERATHSVWKLIDQGHALPLRALLENLAQQSIDTELSIEVSIALGQVCGLMRDSQAAQAACQAALEHLKFMPNTAGVHEKRSRACRWLATPLEYESPEEALQWLQQALQEAQQANPHEEGLVRHRIGSALLARGDYSQAQQELERSLALLPPTALQGRARVLLNLGNIYCDRGETQQGQDYYHQALGIFRAANNYVDMVSVWLNLSIEQENAGDWEGAVANYHQTLKLAEQLGHVIRQANVLLTLGDTYTLRGDTVSAMDYITRGLQLATDYNITEYRINGQICLANLHLLSGEWEAAEHALDVAEPLAHQMGARDQLPELLQGRAQIDLLRKQPGTAARYAQQAVALAHELGMESEEGKGLRLLGQALYADNQPDAASAAFKCSLALLDGVNSYEADYTRQVWETCHLGSNQRFVANTRNTADEPCSMASSGCGR